MNIEIKHLKDCPEHLGLIASWIYNEWWVDKPDVTVDKMKSRLAEATTDSEIPISLVAFVDGVPAGTVNFVEYDNSEFPELKPWLAALLVDPKYRKKGIGSRLINECIAFAKKIAVGEFFLGTDIPEYYQSLGAEIYTTGSKNLKIMRIKI